MTKTDRAAHLIGRVQSDWTPPKPIEGASLLVQGLLCVLTRRLTPTQAESTIKNLQTSFFDWNEVRVAQAQEIVPHVASRAKNGATLLVARDVKTYLQEVFQKNHGFDLEFLREDEGAAGKFLTELEFLGAAASHYLLWVANGEELPVSLDMVRMLDRLGLVGRTTSLKKARSAIEPLVPKGKGLEFAVTCGHVVECWCDRKKPTCWECPLVDDCPYGTKVFKEWKAQQARLAAQRERELARDRALAEKEEARRQREAERRAKKLKKEREKQQRAFERERAAELKRREKERAKKEAEKKKKAAERAKAKKRAAAEKAAARKKASSKKKTASKKAATRKPAAKKSAKKPATKVPRKSASKTGSKKSTAKKKSTKKTGARKSTSKKATKKKTSTRKKTTSKKVAKKPRTAKKSSTRKKR